MCGRVKGGGAGRGQVVVVVVVQISAPARDCRPLQAEDVRRPGCSTVTHCAALQRCRHRQ